MDVETTTTDATDQPIDTSHQIESLDKRPRLESISSHDIFVFYWDSQQGSQVTPWEICFHGSRAIAQPFPSNCTDTWTHTLLTYNQTPALTIPAFTIPVFEVFPFGIGKELGGEWARLAYAARVLIDRQPIRIDKKHLMEREEEEVPEILDSYWVDSPPIDYRAGFKAYKKYKRLKGEDSNTVSKQRGYET